MDRPSVLVHLGMTGAIRVRGEQGLQLVAHGTVEEHWPPRFEKFWLKLENEVEVAFTDPRRFGRLRLRKTLHEPPISDLGPDPIVDEINLSAVSERCCIAEPPIKSVLLDQKFMAGVGNWIADEACYQAKLNPHRLGVDLEQKEAKSLVKKTVSVIQKPVRLMRTKAAFPVRGCSTTAGARSRGLNRQRRIDPIRHHRWTHDRLGASPSELKCVYRSA